MKRRIFKQCQSLFPEWSRRPISDFEFDDPKGFSSFTMGIRCVESVQPPAVLYRHLDGKENAILDFETEKEVFLLLGEQDIAAHCYHYDTTSRIEFFYRGRTLVADDLFESCDEVRLSVQSEQVISEVISKWTVLVNGVTHELI